MKQELVHMRDKLNNISKRNRSIRLLKLYDKWSFDLTRSSSEIAEGIVEGLKRKSTKSFSLLTKEEEKDTANTRKLTTLYRNIKGIEDETGVHDFYLGTPFVSGTFSDGTFFQAPLFLYPVRLEKGSINRQTFELKKDEGEPILNRTLFLAFKKIDQLRFSEEWMDEAQEVASKGDAEIQAFLERFQLAVTQVSARYVPLKEYKTDEIPLKSQLELTKNAIIGHFPQGSSSLVRDYDQLIDLSETSNLSLVGDLLNPENATIMESDWDAQKTEPEDIREFNRLYLLNTDGSQEEILKEARYKKGLAVHGPPGTGKSQVIVNLITDALHQKKRILVVCQKRAALDVVYQRLHSLDLTGYTALVHDENQDRKALYGKINDTLSYSLNYEQGWTQNLRTTSQKLEQQEMELNNIAVGLHSKNENGLSLYDLYSRTKSTGDIEAFIVVDSAANELNAENLEDVLATVYTYAEWYERFGKDSYPLKDRLSFAKFGMKEKTDFTQKMAQLIIQIKKAEECLNLLDADDITPGYTWGIQQDLLKIQPDISDGEPRTMQGLRLWYWTSFTGKKIIEDLNKGAKFSGVKSQEWPKIKKSLLLMNDLAQITSEINKEMEVLKYFLEPSKVEKYKELVSDGSLPVKEMELIQEYLHTDFEDLQHMDQFGQECNPTEQKLIKLLIEKKNQIGFDNLSEKWTETLRQSVYLYWIDKAERKHPAVKKVSNSEYNRLRSNFEELVEKKKELARQYLINELKLSLQGAQDSSRDVFKDLKHQTGKKRQVWPLRKLVNQYADKGLMDVAPVWLASPEIVSSIFPLTENLFDLVIFDEASQCTVENGLPSIYRAKQVIVAGDEMQLPPSNMFMSTIENDEDEEDFLSNDSPSLLNLAKRRFDEKTLQWHYRSKYEELINYSNHAFYNGAIQISPNVQPYKEPPAIQWIKVENGRWIDRANEVEAIKVVEVLKELLIAKQEKSVGIITFNSTQQTKILDMIEKVAIEDMEFGSLYGEVMSRGLDERVFVKNIENVQGDERDIILFSVGYGQNEEGRVYNRFGSLNQEGGENRLNVAVTRAKEETIVVSSIEPEELEVANSKSNGPRLFKDYLKYARAVSNGQIERVQEVIQDVNELGNTSVSTSALQFDSPFEEQVYEQLRNLGYEVQTQVGMSGYRIDLAVIHPNDPSQYIVGIECDGAMYHSSKNAKERDIYRQKFLESRGWTIERIWSRNWWKNQSVEIERIDQVIKALVKKDEVKEGMAGSLK
ncbi:Superfamily I DNA and RNA helicase and helicase subunits-like protein [Planococcus donghaensis MPA1U2]|uniref:Superfamily I DNA and RNA helicase and helicase subunits-like protein n=1 Tax=Planococcus donghaensis MPA1U2 TaxID=933115 RepID=E7RKJ2_9BACL|nr:AAA domain-containing protein [Planococcus donghaensis]EGA88422.1 Superfamily I DNA and RNA helicase and helicase subunits-like protein [Planococcus donghaensis MPA1U2]